MRGAARLAALWRLGRRGDAAVWQVPFRAAA